MSLFHKQHSIKELECLFINLPSLATKMRKKIERERADRELANFPKELNALYKKALAAAKMGSTTVTVNGLSNPAKRWLKNHKCSIMPWEGLISGFVIDFSNYTLPIEFEVEDEESEDEEEEEIQISDSQLEFNRALIKQAWSKDE